MTKSSLSCPLCHSAHFSKYWALPGYHLCHCSNCRFIWDPFPQDNLLSQYEKNYYLNDNPKGGYANYFDGMRINRRTFAHRLSRLSRKTGFRSDLLDIGSALGDCLLEAKKLHWSDIVGLEPSRYAADFSRQRGLKIVNTVLTTSTFSPHSFKVITSQDVLEHIADPVRHLRLLHHLLQPGGWLFIVTPNIGGFWRFLLRSWWYHYKPGEHVSYFSPHNLSLTLKKVGFTHVDIRPTYHVMSLEYIFNRCQYYFPHFFGLLLKTVRHTPLQNIAFSLYTGEMEAWAQKTP